MFHLLLYVYWVNLDLNFPVAFLEKVISISITERFVEPTKDEDLEPMVSSHKGGSHSSNLPKRDKIVEFRLVNYCVSTLSHVRRAVFCWCSQMLHDRKSAMFTHMRGQRQLYEGK